MAVKEFGPLETMRHSAAHLLAAAIIKLFPEAKFGVGPVIENGFYYDVLLSRSLTPDDFPVIEKEMRKIVGAELPMRREEMTIENAIKFFKARGQDFKVELLTDLKTKGTTAVAEDEQLDLDTAKPDTASVYWTGDFVDLCRGPHVENTKNIGAFKIDKIAAAYWRGNQSHPQLQRIYGLCFKNKTDLKAYEQMMEEAKKRDHRKIGQDQELFFVDETVGKGLVMWLPNGTIIQNEIEKLAIEMERRAGYLRVVTPHLAKEQLFLMSGHLPYYKESMFPAMVMDDGTYYLRAMNCPHHHLIYKHSPHSYRDLPLRLAEYGTVYRNELSGTLAGLLRVRGLTMNDAHLYCRKDQIKQEFKGVMEMVMGYFRIFGLKDYWFRLSLWDPRHIKKYINEPENWQYAESMLREALQEMKVPFTEAADEAAFYGPKVDIQFRSVVGREETMSTVQLDFAAKSRFDLTYVDESGAENNEIFVIHRAPLSTHERFVAFLIEHYAGIWPLWLSPVQVKVLAVGEKHKKFARELAAEFGNAGIRAFADVSDETVGKKIRSAEQEKVPYMLVVGDQEVAGGELAVRARGQRDTAALDKSKFIQRVLDESRALK